ncbi:MAG: protein kinase [Myxococcales bacterium]|nr:protein kinase [Myxococcales bacterium]
MERQQGTVTPPENGIGEGLVGFTLEGVYRIDSIINRGATSVVYRGTNIRLDQPIAIKVLAGYLTGDASLMARFEAEAKLQAKLRHPCIVSVQDFIAAEEVYAIVMEYFDGVTLDQVLYDLDGPMPLDRLLGAIYPVLDAISYAHDQGIVHRDIKPSNILMAMVGEREYPKVMDFGIAKVLAQSASQTQPGAMLGTLLYMSPEQCKALKTVDERSDIYSLGVTLYQMATGMVPFYADSAFDIMMAHVQTPPPSPRRLASTIPRKLEEIILKALRKDPGDRYQTVEEMKAELEYVPLSPEETPPSGETARRMGARVDTPDDNDVVRPSRSSIVGRDIVAAIASSLDIDASQINKGPKAGGAVAAMRENDEDEVSGPIVAERSRRRSGGDSDYDSDTEVVSVDELRAAQAEMTRQAKAEQEAERKDRVKAEISAKLAKSTPPGRRSTGTAEFAREAPTAKEPSFSVKVAGTTDQPSVESSSSKRRPNLPWAGGSARKEHRRARRATEEADLSRRQQRQETLDQEAAEAAATAAAEAATPVSREVGRPPAEAAAPAPAPAEGKPAEGESPVFEMREPAAALADKAGLREPMKPRRAVDLTGPQPRARGEDGRSKPREDGMTAPAERRRPRRISGESATTGRSSSSRRSGSSDSGSAGRRSDPEAIFSPGWDENDMRRLKLRVPSHEDWDRFFDPNIFGGGIFCPTQDPPEVGTPVRVEITFVAGPRFYVRGAVTWRRPKLNDPRARAGVGVQVHPSERNKVVYVNSWVQGGVQDKRHLRRLPVKLRVTYTARAGRRINFTRDLNEEGVFVRSQELLEKGTMIKLLLMPPGNGRPFDLRGQVTRVVESRDERGMGIKLRFKSDDAEKAWADTVDGLERAFLSGELPDDVVS